MIWEIKLTKESLKDIKKIKNISMKRRLTEFMNIISENPFQIPPPYEKLQSFNNTYSRRKNIQHRLVYEIIKERKIVKVLRVWTHYE